MIILVLVGVFYLGIIIGGAPQRQKAKKSAKIWDTFKAKDKDNVTLVQYRIETISESRHEEAIEFMAKYYMSNQRNPESLEEEKWSWAYFLDQNISVVCYKNGSNEIIGLSILYINESQPDRVGDIKKERRSTILNDPKFADPSKVVRKYILKITLNRFIFWLFCVILVIT